MKANIMHNGPYRTLRALLAAGATLGLAACASPPPLAQPKAMVSAPARLAAPDAGLPSAGAPDRWWTLWGDAGLDALVEKALVANADIRVAQAHVRAARALVSVSEAALYPSIAANGAAWGTVADTGADGALGSLLAPVSEGATGGGYLVGLGAQWEPDVFGGRHADSEAAKALADSAQWLAQGVALTVIGDMVENYQQWQGLRCRVAILDQSITSARALADYLSARQGLGQAKALDLTKAQAALASLEADRAPLLSLIDARRRRLAVLAGDLPEAMPAQAVSADLTVPPPPAGQFPSAILERRPDVRARMMIVAARAARLKSLKADLMPRFGISFMGQDGHIALSGLPGFGGPIGLVGVKASVPVFTGGLLRGRIAAGHGELEAALAGQDRAILLALEEVETAYAMRTGLDVRLRGLEQARDLSARRVDQAQAFYRAGRMTLGDVLQARLDALADADKVEQAKLAQGTATVQLYRAIAGGWGANASSPGPIVPEGVHP